MGARAHSQWQQHSAVDCRGCAPLPFLAYSLPSLSLAPGVAPHRRRLSPSSPSRACRVRRFRRQAAPPPTPSLHLLLRLIPSPVPISFFFLLGFLRWRWRRQRRAGRQLVLPRHPRFRWRRQPYPPPFDALLPSPRCLPSLRHRRRRRCCRPPPLARAPSTAVCSPDASFLPRPRFRPAADCRARRHGTASGRSASTSSSSRVSASPPKARFLTRQAFGGSIETVTLLQMQ